MGLRRFLFTMIRIFCARTSVDDSAPRWLLTPVTAGVIHLFVIFVDATVIFVLLATLWCLEPLAMIDTNVDTPPSSSSDFAVQGECSFSALILFASVPPFLSIFAPFLGMFAIATQSAPALRRLATLNAVTLISVAAAACAIYEYQLELEHPAILLPVALLLTKFAAVAVLPTELYFSETARPVRGWRGLLAVRSLEGKKGFAPPSSSAAAASSGRIFKEV